MTAGEPAWIGPWQVLGRLGAGGMGVVYEARHRETGERAAVKTLAAAGRQVARALRREVRALAHLRHPGVARIVGDGLDDAIPWYAMGLVEGVRLDDLYARPRVELTATRAALDATNAGADLFAESTRADLASSSALPEATGEAGDLGRVARVFSRLAAVLAWVHGEGVVHRDLKPANVLLRPGDLPVLVDFGLAGAFAGREALDLGVGGGTVTYVSPEQIRGDVVDARADLYALGVMLYRALTGRAPFRGPDAAVVAQHLSQPPLPPSALAAGLPSAVDELVLRLLAKDPRDRIGHAGAVVEALSPWAPGAVPADWPAPKPYLYRPALRGREAAGSWLRERIEAGGVSLIGGGSGLGKTRLLLDAVRWGADLDRLVLTGRALPPTDPGAGPLHPLRTALAQLPEGAFGADAALLAAYVPGVRADGPPPELPPQALRERLVSAVADAFVAGASRQPVLLLLDDLHDADAFTADALLRLADEPRVAVLGTWRADADATALTALLQRGETRRLDPLDASALQALVTDMLAQRAVAEPLLTFLAAHAEGNPLFVAEYLRAAVDRGMLARDAVGRWRLDEAARPDDIGVPASIDALLADRLAALPPDLRDLADVAAVLGRELDLDLLVRASHREAGPVLDGLRALDARQVLAETPTGARFSNPALRDRLLGGSIPIGRWASTTP